MNASLPVLLDDGTRKYVWGLGLAFAVDASGSPIVYHADGLGSVRALTDSSGSVVQSYTYDEYGVVLSSTGSITQPFQYTGEQRDAETGLVYLRARMYDPGIGRFLSRDTQFGRKSNPISLNRAAYVRGNPVRFLDPSGHIAVEQAMAECARNGWRCDDLTHDIAVEILNGNAVDIDWSDPGVLANGSPLDKLLFVAAMANGSGEEGIVAKGLLGELERQLAKDGAKSVKKSLSSITKQLEEHRAKLPNLEFKSSVEREIRNFEQQIKIIQQFMKEKGIG